MSGKLLRLLVPGRGCGSVRGRPFFYRRDLQLEQGLRGGDAAQAWRLPAASATLTVRSWMACLSTVKIIKLPKLRGLFFGTRIAMSPESLNTEPLMTIQRYSLLPLSLLLGACQSMGGHSYEMGVSQGGM